MSADETPGADELPSRLLRIYRVVKRIIEIFVMALMVFMVGLVFVNVIFRYILDFSIAWSAEISRYTFIWLVVLGSVLAFEKDEHLGLDLLPKVIPHKAGLIMLVVADALVLYAIYLMAVGGWQYSISSLQSGWLSPAARVPLGIMQIMLPISACLMFLQGIGKLVINFRELVLDFRTVEGDN